MTTNADLIAEAKRLDAEATPGPWDGHTQLGIDDVGSPDTAFVLRSRTLLPQLADALETAEARLAKVRPAIETARFFAPSHEHGGYDGNCTRCILDTLKEQLAPDRPAHPMENA